MTNSKVYDKAKWHDEEVQDLNLDEFQAFIHGGMYLGWIIDNGMLSPDFEKECEEEIGRFLKREITGPELNSLLDGWLYSDMFNEEANMFSRYYYDGDKLRYYYDYGRAVALELPSLYHVSDTWENYEKVKAIIEKRFRKWNRARRAKWWQFWKKIL